jgi:beta-lactamase regulating signal transducer with metallopeptidase domain
MTPLLEVALANAVLALPLAALAAASSWIRRPAVTHALWLLVLLRLFMPPIWRVPLPEWAWKIAAKERVGAVTTAPPVLEPERPLRPEWAAAVVESASPSPVPDAPPENEPAPETPSFSCQSIVTTFWLGGTVAVLGLAIARGTAFSRSLCYAMPAPAAWQHTCDRLARRLGLRHSPRVWLVNGPVSPLLWAGFGRPRVLLPADLTARLDGRRRAALLAHELAHLRRGDHLVRWLELTATAACWWHPLVWLARRGLREAEEQCCDAWVVWALPAARRAYADALVDTVDFLSSGCPALPPLASGLGTVRHLKRRVVMIMQGKVSRRLSGPGLFTGLALGAMLLAIAPSWGQDTPRRGPDDDRPPSALPRNEARDEDPRRPSEAEDLRRQIRQLHDKLMVAEKRLADIEGRPGPNRIAVPSDDGRYGGRPGARNGRTDPTAPTPPVPPLPPAAPSAAAPSYRPVPAAPEGSDRRLRDLEKELAELRRDIAEMRREMRRPSPPPAATRPPTTPEAPQP